MIRANTQTRATRWIGPALIAAAFIAMLIWTWGRWPDPLVDFGRELYVPWQLSQGKVLYRDLAYFNGPLSPYFNSLLFRILGVSLRTLVLANIAICIAMVVMIWKLFRLAGDRISATVACLLFITLFMTTQYVAIGNYNWIAPYSHELTHGIALSLATILMFVRYMRRPTPIRAGLMGLLVGLVFLTKPEVFIAITPPIGLAMLIARGRSLRSLGTFAVGALVTPIVSATLFGIHGTLGGWMYVFDPRLSKLLFYRKTMGIDDVPGNVTFALAQLGCCMLAFVPAIAIDWIVLRDRASARVRAIVAATYGIALTIILWRLNIGWEDSQRWLPPFLALALPPIAFTQRLRLRALMRLVLIAFALLLTMKTVLFTIIYHYGFALTMPALLVAVSMLLSWIPQMLRLRRPATVQVATLVVVGLITFVYLLAYGRLYSQKPIVVVDGTADAFRADAMGLLVNDVVQALQPQPPQTTVAVVPQGVMINYLAGKANSTPYFTLMPPEILMFGDDNIVAAYAQHPPDIVVIVATFLGEYGFESLDDVAPKTAAWMRSNYQRLQSFNRPGLPPVTILRHVPTTRPQ